MLNKRELATTLAALRFWQRHHSERIGAGPSTLPEAQIATDGGKLSPLTARQIDDLCARLNCDPHTIVVTVSGGVVQNVENVPAGVAVDIRNYDLAGADLHAEGALPRDERGDEYTSALYTAEG